MNLGKRLLQYRRSAVRGILLILGLISVAAGCANVGTLTYVSEPVAPPADSGEASLKGLGPVPPWSPLFYDTTIGFVSGTGDTTRRFLGRLRQGYTADTLNVFLFGDNRPAYRTTRLKPEFEKVQGMFSLNPVKIAKGLITIPVILVKGLFPDLALIRDIPSLVRHMPTYGREKQVLNAMVAKLDSIEATGQVVAAAINTGDLVKDGRRPAHWERFLDLTHPLSSRVPYFAVAGNHERTDTEVGLENWRVATGLPVSGDRLYYCFDSADGWVRFLALDTNPITDPQDHWSREVEVKYSDEQIDWLVARVKEHIGPAFIFMHHPPFSIGYHRDEWQYDAVLRERRQRMVQSLKEAGISILTGAHEHGYQRALLTWPDAVLVTIVTGGAGSPLVHLPSQQESAQIMSQYRVAGSVIKPENVFTASAFHFIQVRLWFGGGELYTYEVDKHSKTRLIDHVEIDLKRYGVPQIDQQKMVVVPKGPEQPAEETRAGAAAAASAQPDTSAQDKKLTEPPPEAKAPAKPPAKKKSRKQ